MNEPTTTEAVEALSSLWRWGFEPLRGDALIDVAVVVRQAVETACSTTGTRPTPAIWRAAAVAALEARQTV